MTTTLPEALRMRSRTQPDDVAYVFLQDGEEPTESMAYRELDLLAGSRAAALAGMGLAGSRVVMVYPPGLEFVRSLLGCMYAGIAGAPVSLSYSRQGVRRLRRIARDAATTTLLTTAAVKQEFEANYDQDELAGMTMVATDDLSADGVLFTGPAPESIALLQYTSGSTGDPKGVVVTHANFASIARESDDRWPAQPGDTAVSWLPVFHDLGLLFGIILPLWTGMPSYLMAPEAFVRRPIRWLEAISRYRGTHGASPNFGYELCLRAAETNGTSGVEDLSNWRLAGSGGEPVRWRTIRSFVERFAPLGLQPRAMTPGYGLAENTLTAAANPLHVEPSVLWVSTKALGDDRVEVIGPDADGAVPVVGSGVPVSTTRIRIVNPDTRVACLPDGVGEIWIDGPCVAAGYWGRPGLSEQIFRARVVDDDGIFLRTGDLGFLHDGEVYVTGRIKDVIICNGRNYYPQDIELTAEVAVPGLHPNCAAAFSIDDGAVERLVVVVEADGRVLRSPGAMELHRRVRDAIWVNHHLDLHDLVIVRRGSLSKTSSGKIQRRACRRRYEDGELPSLVLLENQP
jgi:acyl-CoA synthetase (AMP-forming)/AMP-acid ligase II